MKWGKKKKKIVASICYQVFLLQRKSVLYRVKTLNLEGEKKVPLYSVPVMRWLSYANAGTQSCMFNGQMLNLSLTVWTDKRLANGFWGESILPTKTNLNFNDTLKAPKVSFFFFFSTEEVTEATGNHTEYVQKSAGFTNIYKMLARSKRTTWSPSQFKQIKEIDVCTDPAHDMRKIKSRHLLSNNLSMHASDTDGGRWGK